MNGKWRFCIDRGGTFTDIIALAPNGEMRMEKTPSDSIRGGMQIARRLLALPDAAPLPADRVSDIRVGTTIATNMLLEQNGAPPLFLTTQGFADILIIGDQTRPHLFATAISRPPPLYAGVIEARERLDATGNPLQPLDAERLRADLMRWRSNHTATQNIAIAFMHAARQPAHELQAAAIARDCGFTRITMSHDISGLGKFVPRARTAVADSYLQHGVRQYADAIARQCEPGVEVLFMQSNGALVPAAALRAVNTILSGPAGGAVGAKKSARQAGIARAVGFDMGGTSTDVCLSVQEEEDDDSAAIRLENEVAGQPLFVPMLDIATVAAGGGSIVKYEDQRLQVGPQSAGARPGPACYGNGGPLAITDCNLLLGKLAPQHLPAVFGKNGDQPPDAAIVQRKFADLARATGIAAPQLAEGFIHIAVEQMAGAIRKLAAARAANIAGATLNCFGGAAGQHACLVADAAGASAVLAPRQGSVLSAWGLAAADIGALKSRSVECAPESPQLHAVFAELESAATADIAAGQHNGKTNTTTTPIITRLLRCRYQGAQADIPIAWQPDDPAAMRHNFTQRHQARYGYTASAPIIAAVAEARAVLRQPPPAPAAADPAALATPQDAIAATRRVIFAGRARQTPFYDWDKLPAGAVISAPAIIFNPLSSVTIEPHWRATLLPNRDLLLQKTQRDNKPRARNRAELISIMNSRFAFVTEQMGERLRQTAQSVNIRERLDFSCALFDGRGNLVANAPHIPVHLGSMSDSVRRLHRRKPPGWLRGDTFLHNSPYHGGTHLPDLTVIRPGWLQPPPQNNNAPPDFYVAARGHHADIGGISPGSMPAVSSHISQEGVLFDIVPLVANGKLQKADILRRLAAPPHPARAPQQNIADLQAQIAAVASGSTEMQRAASEFGAPIVRRYLRAVQDNAAAAARRALQKIGRGCASVQMDCGARIAVAISPVRAATPSAAATPALFDFTGTSAKHAANFNAPAAIARAAVIYCLRLLLGENIPLNDGLLRPVTLRLPQGSLLRPRAPAAVAAGNVETSQNIVDAVLAALGICANAQGSCNNLTIGAADKQYYETICGGMGATDGAHGTSAVQVHMTNSRASDPEALERAMPLILETFALRRGSGGAGQWRGGDGAIRILRFLTDGEANLLTSRRAIAPQGIAGGGAGQCGQNTLRRANGKTEPLTACAQATLRPDDALIIKTPGGGGWGKIPVTVASRKKQRA